MAFSDFMDKIRRWDNLTAKWIMRHFYFMFFQAVLLIIFLFWFVNMFKVIDASFQADPTDILQRLLVSQSINTTIIVLLLLLNSFWILYIFNGIQRLRVLLRDISYNINKLRQQKSR